MFFCNYNCEGKVAIFLIAKVLTLFFLKMYSVDGFKKKKDKFREDDMKSMARSVNTNLAKRFVLGGEKKENVFNLPLCDIEIITLQKTLMTSSISEIKTENIFSGRSVLRDMFTSLNYYKNIGCITFAPGIDQQYDFVDVIHLMQTYYGDLDLDMALEIFLTQFFNFDFVIIELSSLLKKWIDPKILCRIIELLSEHNKVPICLISYQNEQILKRNVKSPPTA